MITSGLLSLLFSKAEKWEKSAAKVCNLRKTLRVLDVTYGQVNDHWYTVYVDISAITCEKVMSMKVYSSCWWRVSNFVNA